MMNEAERKPNTPAPRVYSSRTPALMLLRARTAFADAVRNRFLEMQRSDRPVSAYLLEKAQRLHLPNIPMRRLLIENHYWQRGLVVDRNWRLDVDWRRPIDDWMMVRDYIANLVRNGFDLDTWLDAEEYRIRGLAPGQAEADPPSGETLLVITPLPGYTSEDYQQFRAWLLKWPNLYEPRGDHWCKWAVAKAREADELKGFKITHRLLKDVIRQYPDLQKRRQKDPPKTISPESVGTSPGCT